MRLIVGVGSASLDLISRYDQVRSTLGANAGVFGAQGREIPVGRRLVVIDNDNTSLRGEFAPGPIRGEFTPKRSALRGELLLEQE
jgi:hypothetical protein